MSQGNVWRLEPTQEALKNLNKPEPKGDTERLAGKLSQLLETNAAAAAVILRYKDIDTLRADVKHLHTLLAFEPLGLEALPDLDTLELPSPADGLELPELDTSKLITFDDIPLPDFEIQLPDFDI